MSPFDLVLTPLGLRYHRRTFPVSVGRSGVSVKKREGDGATPAGIHHIIGTLYRPDRIAASELPPWAVPIGLRDRWCDAPGHPDYNHLVREAFGPSDEKLRRSDPLYDVVLLTDWNWPEAVPYGGSAIFLHGWRRPGYPTAGCLAFRRDHLIWIANRATPGTRVIVNA